MKKKMKFNWLFIPVHLGGILPLLWLVWQVLNGELGANPIQAAILRMGKTALTLLLVTLTCTPLYTIIGSNKFIRVRRALGLYTFSYALMHVSLVLGVDYGLNIPVIVKFLLPQTSVLAGVGAFLILLPMAITSFRWWKKKMGRNWKRLHRLVYLAAPLAVLHFAWVLKGDIFRLQGNVGQPLIFAGILALLLLLRLPFIREGIVNLRQSRLALTEANGVGLKNNQQVREKSES